MVNLYRIMRYYVYSYTYIMISKMLSKKQIFTLIAGLLLVINVHAGNKDTLVIGKVSVKQSKADYVALMSLAKKFVPELKAEGIEKVDVYLASSVTEMIDAVKDGKVDWVSDSLFVLLLLSENTRSDAFLSRSREIKKYSTVFFVSKESESKSISDIKKKIILFGDQISTNRYFVPFYELTSHGYIPIVYGMTGDESGKKKNIFYRYEKNQDKIIQEVMSNALNIGVLNNEEYRMLPDNVKAGLRVIHRTVGFPETLDLIRFDLNINLKLKLKKLLLGSEKINQKNAKEKEGITRFEKFIAEGRDGYVFLRGIIKHNVVPNHIKKIEKKEDLKELKDKEIYDRIMAEP